MKFKTPQGLPGLKGDLGLKGQKGGNGVGVRLELLKTFNRDYDLF
jgi:hypothetical protein